MRSIIAAFLCLMSVVVAEATNAPPASSVDEASIDLLVNCLKSIGTITEYNVNERGNLEFYMAVGTNGSEFQKIRKCYSKAGLMPYYGMIPGVIVSVENGKLVEEPYDEGDLDDRHGLPNLEALRHDPKFLATLEKEEVEHNEILAANQPSGDAAMQLIWNSGNNCKGSQKCRCDGNTQKDQCTYWEAMVPNSADYWNNAGHEHQMIWWPHHECRSKGVGKKDSNCKIQHAKGEYNTFRESKNGQKKCFNEQMSSWYIFHRGIYFLDRKTRIMMRRMLIPVLTACRTRTGAPSAKLEITD